MYDYFYGAQADQFSFIRVPTVLFSDEQFKNMSAEAKVLYGILLKRMDLSAKNGWLRSGHRRNTTGAGRRSCGWKRKAGKRLRPATRKKRPRFLWR